MIQDGFWFQTARNSAGQEEAGWGGEFHVVDPHRVQATDNVCTITYGFSVSGDTVSLRVIHEVGPPADCKMAFQRPGDGTAGAQKLGEQNFMGGGDGANYGAMFANKIMVECR